MYNHSFARVYFYVSENIERFSTKRNIIMGKGVKTDQFYSSQGSNLIRRVILATAV